VDLRIAHLYPDLMSIYGDRGNVVALTQRARWRDIPVEVRAYTAGMSFDSTWPDLFFFGGGQDQHNKQSNVFDVAVNYIATVGAVDVGASAGYVTGQSEINDSPGFFGNVWDWGGAVNLGYREWTAGAAYRRTNVAGGGPVEEGLFLSNVYDGNDTEIWSAGLTYATGPWAFGVDYITSREQLPFSRDQNGKGMEGSIGYTFDEHIRLVGGYQHFQFDGPFGVCLTDAGGGGCDSLDANVGFVETKFSF